MLSSAASPHSLPICPACQEPVRSVQVSVRVGKGWIFHKACDDKRKVKS